MKKLWNAVAVVALAGASMSAQAEVTGNVGWDSEYIFRGVPQSDSSASGGVDWATDEEDSGLGLYVGTWAADVDEGLEIDYYGGVTATVGDFDFLLGATYYDYTDDFDDTYKEINLGADWKFLSFAAAVGEYDNFDGPTQDYQYYEVTAEHNGFFATVGSFQDDFDGEYIKAGYGTQIVGIDVTGYYVYSNKDLLGPETGSDQSIVVQVNKSFSFQQVVDAWNGIQKSAAR
jgi:uncharacterized protein (TIGR02001 family)